LADEELLKFQSPKGRLQTETVEFRLVKFTSFQSPKGRLQTSYKSHLRRWSSCIVSIPKGGATNLLDTAIRKLIEE